MRATPTIVCAARWKTESHSPADRRVDRLGVAQVGLDQLDLGRDPEQVEAGAARPPTSARAGRAGRGRGPSSPRSSSARARCEATKPWPPVTSDARLHERRPTGRTRPRCSSRAARRRRPRGR